MSKKPILSICIPTYNREKYLKGLLENIIHQKGFSDEVEVFIYDDPSTDGTEALMQGYIQLYPNIIYHRNTVRVGMTAAFVESALLCTGEYVWLFGSDDVMGPQGLDTMLQIIKKDHPDLILNNYGKLEFMNTEVTDPKYHMYADISDFCNNFHLSNENSKGLSLMDHYVSYFSYISIYCFRAEVYRNQYNLAIEEGKKDYILKHYFNFSYILFGNKNLKNICLCILPILTYNQSGEVSWRMNMQIVRETYSVLVQIAKNNSLSGPTKILFRKIFFTWFRWLIESEIYHSFIMRTIRTKYQPAYLKLIDIYRYIRD